MFNWFGSPGSIHFTTILIALWLSGAVGILIIIYWRLGHILKELKGD